MDGPSPPRVYNRTHGGKFGSGNGGRPMGSKNRFTLQLAAGARRYSAEALAAVVQALRHGESWNVRLRAAEVPFDRGFGRAPQQITLDVPPLDYSSMADADLSALLTRLDAFVVTGGEAQPQVIDVEPVDALRDPAVDEGERT